MFSFGQQIIMMFMSKANNKKTKAYSYIRMSSKKQLHGDSLRRQLEATQKYAEANGLILDDTLRDLGVSAYTAANVTEGALGQFLSLVRERQIPSGSVLIVESLDRISRAKVLDAFDIFREIVRAGIQIHTLENGKTYTHKNINDNFSDLLICLGIMARANEESERKSERLGAMWDQKHHLAQKGVPIGGLKPAWIEYSESEDKYFLIPERSALIKRMFAETITGYGRRMIAMRFNAEKIPTWGRSKNGWSASYIGKILDGRSVLGEYQPYTGGQRQNGKRIAFGEPAKDYWPKVIDEETWLRARAASKRRKLKPDTGGKGRKGYVTNIFRKIARCGLCGCAMRLRTARARDKYLVCDGRSRGTNCEHTSFHQYARIEQALLDGLLQEIDLDSIGEEKTIKKPDLQEELKKAKIELAESTRTLDKLVESFRADSIPQVAQRIREIHEDVRGYKEKILDLEDRLAESQVKPSIKKRQSNITALAEKLKNADDEEASRLRGELTAELRRVVRKITFFPDRVAVFEIGGEHTDMPDRTLYYACFCPPPRRVNEKVVWQRFLYKKPVPPESIVAGGPFVKLDGTPAPPEQTHYDWELEDLQKWIATRSKQL
ncbi:recombinase family protein [Pseudodesulfovibrio profundus]|uniref:recombinase family protein n=1 Tax=Pseudodesulfovibrio profundus TaxID=57320 RepID=UPI0012FF5FEC|nr:recombinase family protein [Pseudodesulfovibrio profundus]